MKYQTSASVRLFRTSSALRRRILRKLSDKSERIVARHEMAGGVFESDACLVYSFCCSYVVLTMRVQVRYSKLRTILLRTDGRKVVKKVTHHVLVFRK